MNARNSNRGVDFIIVSCIDSFKKICEAYLLFSLFFKRVIGYVWLRLLFYILYLKEQTLNSIFKGGGDGHEGY